MSIDVNLLLTYLAKILGCIFAGFCITVVPKLRALLQSKLSASEMLLLETLIKEFVAAADQMFKTEDPDGSQRKAYVENQLAELGYTLTSQINSMIESAVLAVNLEEKAAEKSETEETINE